MKIILMLMLSLTFAVQAKTVKYDLNIENKPMNMSGKKTVGFALTVNGGIPAPTLEFTEGDDAEITVHNGLKNEEVSVHWHGILLPPEMDGVAYVNTPPIFPGQSFTFKYRLRQHGTYWYHSHTMVQEQKGVYGALVIHPKKENLSYDKEAVAVISDWSDENADQIIRNLRKDGDYYLHKKGTVRSYLGALGAGGFGSQLKNEWTRMGGMDLSDVGYDAFLINGKRESQLVNARPGERVRLRLINAGSSSYFYVSLGEIPMQVVSADGVDIAPMSAKEILMGMAETYDVIFTVPEAKNYELRATAQDVTGFASAWIGLGDLRVAALDKPAPDLYASMDHPHDHAMAGMDHHSMDHMHHHEAAAVETLTVDELKAQTPTTLPPGKPVQELKLVLDGDMSRYVWLINGKAIFEDRLLTIEEGSIVRYTLVNNTMMHHPMHLHGHFFRVLNKNGELSPLKHTVDVPPHGSRTIEFYANEPGQWMLHCHNLYHMKSGMARVVKYAGYTPAPEMAGHASHDPHLHDHLYYTGKGEVFTNQAQGKFRISQTWNELELRVEHEKETEGDLFYKRWFNRYFNVIAGGTSFADKETGVVGVGYVLPMLIESHLLINHEGKFRLDLEKRLQWTRTVLSDVEYNWRPDQGGHEHEIEVSLMYQPDWHWSGGLKWTNESLGAGLEVRF